MKVSTAIVEPTEALLLELTPKLSANDIKDCLLNGFKTAAEAIIAAFKSNEIVGVGLLNQEPVMAIGVRPIVFESFIKREGLLWIIASDAMRKAPVAVLRQSLYHIKELMKRFDTLISCVDASDTRSLRYNHFLGFTDTGRSFVENGRTFKYLTKNN